MSINKRPKSKQFFTFGMKGYIYKYTFPDGKVYIGQTRRSMTIRHREHLNPSTGPLNPGFWEAYQKVGLPKLTILETIESEDLNQLVDELNQLENFYINRERAADKRFGYNRLSFSSAHSPNITILNQEFARLCQQFDEEKRPFFDNLTKKLFNRKDSDFSEEERDFVENYILNNNLFFDKSKDTLKSISKFFLGEAIDYAIWLYNDETHETIAQYISENSAEIIRMAKQRRTKQGRIIQQLDMEGNVVREFDSQDSIREAFNIMRIDNIMNVIKGRQKTAYGFRWRYKPDE